jgi:hypothetical protein
MTEIFSKGKWNAAFAPAMAHLSVLGIPQSDQANFIDCTSAVPSGSNVRLVRAAPINDRIRSWHDGVKNWSWNPVE